MNKNTTVELNDLPLDAFDIDHADLQVESLTAGHGMIEAGASGRPFCACCCSC